MRSEKDLSPHCLDIGAAIERHWDFVILGSGMGGSAAAYKLAKSGKRVLLIEKGYSAFHEAKSVVAEQKEAEQRLQSGKWPVKLKAIIDEVESEIWAPLGCGTGGSTLLYAAALQRLRRADFDSQSMPSGEQISWPFSYDEIEPFYAEAESLFSVCGTPDLLDGQVDCDLRAPPKMSDTDAHLFDEFTAAGLHPYRLHTAIKYESPCTECSGQICLRSCKQDAVEACLKPALLSNNLFIVCETEVVSLDANEDRVERVLVRNNGEEYWIAGGIIVLSAGAYFSPVILQKSRNQHWPDGLGNRNDLLGRNLMFHASDFIAVWPRKKISRAGPRKTLAFRDLYQHNGTKLGEFQSTGHTADYGNVLYALYLMFDQSRFRKLTFLKHFLRIPAFIAAKLFGKATIFATIVEDYPYPENRIVYDEDSPAGMRFEYNFHGEFRERVLLFRSEVRKRMKPLKSLPMASHITLNFGHPCGTCVAGRDPESSVLDENCKVHELENLYVLDGSFMPTSGGTNPSLTIAANALRVADKIANQN